MSNLAEKVAYRLWKPIDMANLAYRADGFLVSYPKSGRTWFRFILSSYFAEVGSSAIVPDLHTMFSIVPNFDRDPVRGIPAFKAVGHGDRIPLIAVSHLEHRRRLFLNRPAIFMVRDPRDVIVSSYFHETRQKKRFEGSMDAFIGDPQHGLPHLLRYLNGWSAGLAGRRHHVLSYEGLSAHPEAETAKVLAFLNCEIDRGALARAVAAGAFERMRDLEVGSGLPGHDYDRQDTESLRMRRGKAGGFAAYLTTGQIETIEARCARDLLPATKRILAKTGFPVTASTVGKAA